MVEQSPVDRYDPFEGGLGFSLATRVGNLVYTSGMVGVDPNLNVPDDVAEEFRLVFENLAGVLEAVGTSLEHVVDSTILSGPMAILGVLFDTGGTLTRG